MKSYCQNWLLNLVRIANISKCWSASYISFEPKNIEDKKIISIRSIMKSKKSTFGESQSFDQTTSLNQINIYFWVKSISPLKDLKWILNKNQNQNTFSWLAKQLKINQNFIIAKLKAYFRKTGSSLNKEWDSLEYEWELPWEQRKIQKTKIFDSLE